MTKKTKTIIEYSIYIIILFTIFFIGPKYIMEKITVDGISMETTLYNNEHVLIEKIDRYFSGPKRFDIIVFGKNNGKKELTYIKRVIGLPGESVQIIGSTIYINGTPLQESYGSSPMTYEGIAKEGLILGQDEYFVLGDNREISGDSRSFEIGPVNKKEIDGTVILRIYPFDKFGTVK